MFRIIKKESLNPTVTRMVVEAPLDAKSARQELSTIRRVSNVMIGDMNRVLDTHDRKQPQRENANREER